MTTDAVIDIDSLTAPISDDAPAGSDLREVRSENYYAIKSARNSARAEERNSLADDIDPAHLLPNWEPVLQLAPKILTEESKDLEVASWFIEALTRFEGFAGLRDGFAMVNRMVDNFWDSLYPVPDEDGLETKVAPLTGLNGDGGEGTLLAPIRNLPITGTVSTGSLSYWTYTQVQEASRLEPAAQNSRLETIGISLNEAKDAINQGSAGFYSQLIEDIEAALEEFTQLGNKLYEKCGHDAPPTSQIRELLEEVLRAVRFISKDKIEAQADSAAGAESTGEILPSGTTVASGTAVAASDGVIASRTDALRRLREVADYFKATEPHTPLVSGIERLIEWGSLPLPELMLQLIPDHSAREMYSQLTGVNLSEEDEVTSASSNHSTTTATSSSVQEDSGSAAW